MDDTTRRDVIPPNFDSPSWAGAGSPVASRADAPTRPTNAAAYDRPTGATSRLSPIAADDRCCGSAHWSRSTPILCSAPTV